MADLEPLRDRFRGCLLGLAVGDALGAPAESMPEGQVAATFGRLQDYLGRDWLAAGATTDDTAMALCIARSLVERGAVDLSDIAAKFVEWMVADGAGIGLQTAAVLSRIQSGEHPFLASRAVWERSGRRAAGNGGVMRCAPIGLFDWSRPDDLLRDSRETCRLTHPDPRCEWSCVAVNHAIASLLSGDPAPLASARAAVAERCPEIGAALGRAADTPVSAMRVDGWDMGYTIVTTEIAFAALAGGRPFEEALVDVVAKGGDTDTNAAVAGALLGARDGYRAIPQRWRDELEGGGPILHLADALWQLATERA
jgi:ADP-ribosyl-[dinitrogen reductase] hydrolase